MKKQRIFLSTSCLPVFLRAALVSWVFAATVATASPVDILSPYNDVDWTLYGQYKANLHTHTLRNRVKENGNVVYASGEIRDATGDVVLQEPVDGYSDVNPHPDFLNAVGVDGGSDGRMTVTDKIDAYHDLGYDVLAITDHNRVTWPWQAYGRDPASLGMIAIQGSEPSNHHHIGSFFQDHDRGVGSTEAELLEYSLQAIGSKGGLSMIYHPGRYTYSLERYVELYETYDHLIGMEVYNMGDRYPGDRVLWDQVLMRLMPERPVWGFANDDAHFFEHIGKNWQTLLLPELTEAAVRHAMENGHFYFSHARDGHLVGGGNPAPQIQSVTIDENAAMISIEASGYDTVAWILNGQQIAEGSSSIDVSPLRGTLRAVLIGPTGRTYTQPFYIMKEGPMIPPDARDFEGVIPGTTPRGIGWLTEEVSVSSVIEHTYEIDGEWPLPDSTHTQVLNLGSRDEMVLAPVVMEPGSFPSLYLDTMVFFHPGDPPPVEDFAGHEGVKLAGYMNPEGHLVVFHGGHDGETGTFTQLDGRFTPQTWRRVTVDLVFDSGVAGEGGDIPFFRVRIDGETQSSPTEGFASPSSAYGGGSWFRFANYGDQVVGGTQRTIRNVSFSGVGMVDDVVLTDEEPAPPARPLYHVRTVQVGSGTIDPEGVWTSIPFEAHEVPVKSGDYIDMVFTADAFHEVAELTSDGVAVPDAAGQSQVEWHLADIRADVSNRVVFAELLWDGDGRSPLWWADARGYADGGALTVHEGYLLHQTDLDHPFELLGMEIDEQGRVLVRWISTGPAHGIVSVLASPDLVDPAWSALAGGTVHDGGVNTWTSHATADPNRFFRIRVSAE